MIRFCWAVIRSSALFLFVALFCHGQEKPASRFESDVLPLLKARCVSCHGSQTKQAGLSLENRDDLLTGGKTGAAIVPGRSVDSLLVAMISTGKMPLGGKPLST